MLLVSARSVMRQRLSAAMLQSFYDLNEVPVGVFLVAPSGKAAGRGEGDSEVLLSVCVGGPRVTRITPARPLQPGSSVRVARCFFTPAAANGLSLIFANTIHHTRW